MSSPNTLSIISSPTTAGGSPGAGSSRGSTPDREGNALVQSMESLVISDDSSEDGTEEGLSLRLDHQHASEDAIQLEDHSVSILGGGDDEDPHFEDSTVPILEDQEESKAISKGKKRRISSRRQRKISLKASDKDVFRIAGVEVSLALYSLVSNVPPSSLPQW